MWPQGRGEAIEGRHRPHGDKKIRGVGGGSGEWGKRGMEWRGAGGGWGRLGVD